MTKPEWKEVRIVQTSDLIDRNKKRKFQTEEEVERLQNAMHFRQYKFSAFIFSSVTRSDPKHLEILNKESIVNDASLGFSGKGAIELVFGAPKGTTIEALDIETHLVKPFVCSIGALSNRTKGLVELIEHEPIHMRNIIEVLETSHDDTIWIEASFGDGVPYKLSYFFRMLREGGDSLPRIILCDVVFRVSIEFLDGLVGKSESSSPTQMYS